MTEQEYIQQRIDDQTEWLSRKSGSNQKLFKRCRLAEIVLASAIPVVAVLPLPELAGKVLVAAAGAAIAVIAGAVSLWRFQELWVQYRATAEALRREKFLYLTAAAPYSGQDRFALLVSRVEALLAAENASWVELAKAQPAAPKAGDASAPAGAADR